MPLKAVYRRVLLKLSGEALMGDHKYGIDPAVASGPLITSSIDVLGILTYFSIAWALL